MATAKTEKLAKTTVIEKFLEHKENTLEDFRNNQRYKLEQASNEDLDNRQTESKSEETLHELKLLNHNVEILEKEIISLRNIPVDVQMEQVQFGSLVETDKAIMLVGSAHETMEIDGIKVIGISTSAPLYEQMEGLVKGKSFEVNGTEHKILNLK